MKEAYSRLLVGIIGPPLILFAIIFGKFIFLIFIIILFSLGLREMDHISRKKGIQQNKTVIALFSIIFFLASFYGKSEYFIVIIILFPIVLLISELYREGQNHILNVASSFFSFFYLGMFLGSIILIREYSGHTGKIEYHDAGKIVVIMFISVWICDTAAYYVGKGIGKHSLFLRISPRKTVEGAAAGFIGSIITVLIFYFLDFIRFFSLIDYLIFGLITGIAGQFGDLIESMIKRDADIKDSSKIIPGHGGVLDRFDSIIFVSPIIYLYLNLKVF
ncbi:MAG: phosphatidate cytidylyltransferase [Fidelibacterota bacterium]